MLKYAHSEPVVELLPGIIKSLPKDEDIKKKLGKKRNPKHFLNQLHELQDFSNKYYGLSDSHISNLEIKLKRPFSSMSSDVRYEILSQWAISGVMLFAGGIMSFAYQDIIPFGLSSAASYYFFHQGQKFYKHENSVPAFVKKNDSNSIFLPEKTDLFSFSTSFVHEYSHCLFYNSGYDYELRGSEASFVEGFASFSAKNILKEYSQEKGQDNYYLASLNSFRRMMNVGYISLCDELNLKKDEELESELDPHCLTIASLFPQYIVGYNVFSVLEKIKGPDFLKEILDNDLSSFEIFNK